MSAHYTDLVMALTPPGRRYHVATPTAYRTRFVLFMLAHLADDDGRCTVSLTDLHAHTTLQPPMIRTALRELETDELVTIHRQASAANTYTLNATALEARQFMTLQHQRGPSIEVLIPHGLDTRALNALHRGEIKTLSDLGAAVDAHRRENPDDEMPFHRFLDIRGLGEDGARTILGCYHAWLDETAPRTSAAHQE